MAMILAHYGRHVDLETLRRISGVSRDCVDAKDLLRIADHFGLDARVVRTEPDRLQSLGFPLVVFTDFIHFTVVEGIDERDVQLADPGFGRFVMPREEFDESFTGVALFFSPSERFRPGGVPITLWRRIRRQLNHCPPGLVLTALVSQAIWAIPLLPALLDLARPIGAEDANFIGLGIAGLLGAGMALAVSAWASARVEDRYCRNRLSGMARHVLAQSHAFFVYRVHSVLAQRIGGHDALAETLFRVLLPAAAAVVAVPLLLSALAVVHLPSAVLAAFLIGLFLRLNLAADRAAGREGRVRQDDRDAHWMKLSHSLENFESFKTSGGDREFFKDAMGLCARRLDIRQRTGLMKGGAELSADLTYFLMWPGVLICFWAFPPASDGAVRTLIAAFALITLLLPPLRAVARLHGRLEALHFMLPPLDDLSDCSNEFEAPHPPMVWPARGAALCLREVRFGFSSVKPPLFDAVTVTVRPGEWVALTGPSGGGKSALAALMIGLHRPWAGMVQLDDKPISAIGTADLARRIGWLDKHPFFALGTIRDNLCLWDNAVSESDLEAAVADACLEDVIAGFPAGLDTPLAPRAANLSGGQRQRLELARILTRNPGLVVIDEATDGLDPETERRVFENLRRRGVTVLIISHRASTLAACDRTLLLSEGRLASDASMTAVPLSESRPDPYTGSEQGVTSHASSMTLRTGDLTRVFELAAKASRIPAITIPACSQKGTARSVLMDLARHNQLILRPVRFVVAEWWRRDCGPLIGFRKQDGRPVAILPNPSGAGYLQDPDGGTFLLSDGASELMPTAYRIYPRFAPKVARAHDFFRFPLRPVGKAMFEGVVSDLLLAGLLACGPVAALFLLSDGGTPPGYWGIGIAFWAVAIVVLGATRLSAQNRVEGILELSAHSALYQHLMRIQPLFIRNRAPQEVNRSLQAIPELLNVLRNGASRRLFMGATVIPCLVVVAVLTPHSVGLASFLLTPFVVVPALLAWCRSDAAAAVLRLRPAGRVFLAAMTKSAAKLRQSGRTEAALGVWDRLVDTECGPTHQVRRCETVAEAALQWFAFAVVGCFALTLLRNSPVTTQGGAAILAFLLAAIAAWQASGALCEIIRIGPALRRLQRLADAPVDPPSPTGVVAAVGTDVGSLDLRQVGYRYPGVAQRAVDGVSLRIGPGEIVALTGPSGCGKSTLLRLILGFLTPDEGQILREGKPLVATDISAWREEVGAVLQDDELEQAMTIRGHIGGDEDFTLPEIREAARQAQLEPDLDAMPMGIQTIVDSERISTGQKQRILIARRLIRRPKLLILDEATNALPDAQQLEIFAAIRALGIGCLVVSHRASALGLADRVYRMEGGSLIAENAAPTSPGASLVPEETRERTPEWMP